MKNSLEFAQNEAEKKKNNFLFLGKLFSLLMILTPKLFILTKDFHISKEKKKENKS